MKKLTLLTTLTISLMFSPVCWGEWVKVTEGVDGDSYYVEFDSIRQHGGYVYYWSMGDYLTPSKYGDMSVKTYKQGDCEMFRHKYLSYIYYKEPMGKGVPDQQNSLDTTWKYPPPDTSIETILKSVCSFVKTK